MTVAIMQPYLFPYIGYFQLIASCDHFVVYDDVQFIKSGWINRNRLLSGGAPVYFNFRLKGSSTYDKINEKQFTDLERDRMKFLKSLQSMYGRAPHFAETYELVRDAVENEERNVSRYVTRTLEKVCACLGLGAQFHVSSQMNIPEGIHAQDRVLWINESLKADRYVNVEAGRALYSAEVFAQHGIELKFLHPCIREYRQFKGEFVPGLSIIDVMMFNDTDTIREMLKEAELV